MIIHRIAKWEPLTVALLVRLSLWPQPELWCDWKWEVSHEERGRILTELTRFSETVEGGYR